VCYVDMKISKNYQSIQQIVKNSDNTSLSKLRLSNQPNQTSENQVAKPQITVFLVKSNGFKIKFRRQLVFN
jgi:hypothetical protein